MRLSLLCASLATCALSANALAQSTPTHVRSATGVTSAASKAAVKPYPKGQAPFINPVQPQPTGSTALVGGSDSCTTPDVITGTGTFSFDNTSATTGPQGQGESACLFFGQTDILQDVWFRWTASFTGNALVNTCGITGVDTKIAVYDGAGCPSSAAIACNDDACIGFQTTLLAPVTSGNTYTIQLGLYPGTSPPAVPGAGVFSLTQAAAAANDDCATPTVIAGTGTFTYDNTFATAGSQGQAEAICTFFGSPALQNDVWFEWTSSFTGTARVATCGTSVDTKIAAYAGTGCPSSAALACNDDACGLQTRLDFPVASGGVYTLQIGLYPFTTTGGASTFTIESFLPATNDDCSQPIALSGAGPYGFDTTSATTGSQGQAEALCNFFGSPAIFGDVWFTYTAAANGNHELSLCAGGVAYDSKVAVYDGAGCPTAAAIACNDDSCGLVTALCFAAQSGQTYTIQIGGFATTSSGAGTFSITAVMSGPTGCTPQDDGSSENSVGLTAGGAMGWLVGFEGNGISTIQSVATCFGTPQFPGGYTPSGPVTIYVWEDPNDDGNPTDCTLLGTTSVTVSPASISTDIFQTIVLTPPVSANGVFFVGAVVAHLAGEFPGPLDQSSGSGSVCGAGPGSWVVGSSTGMLNANNLSANDVPPQSMSSVGLPGNWLLRANCTPGTTGTRYCFGDGSGTGCPCGNSGASGNGCASSTNANGANLTAMGNPSVSNDSVVLMGSGMGTTSPCLYFQGTTAISIPFGDGLRCAGGTIIRLSIKTNSGGASQYPGAGNASVSVRGLLPQSGGQRSYQTWYRSVGAFCTPSVFNLTNGLSILWQP